MRKTKVKFRNTSFLVAALSLFLSFFSYSPALGYGYPPSYVYNSGFETGNFNDWVVSGNAFTVTNDTNWGWGGDFNHIGTYHVWGAKNGDDKTGTLSSSTFRSSGTPALVSFLIGGGNDINNEYVALINADNGQELNRATGTDSETYRRVVWEIPAGTNARFNVVDNAVGSWGHINVDDFQVGFYPLNLGFESGDLTRWSVVSGTAFSAADVTSESTYWGGSFNQSGTYHLWGFKDGGDGDTGVLKSDNFILSGNGSIQFKIGGGNDINNLYVALVKASNGQEVFKATGSDTEQYSTVTWNAADYIGETLYIKVVDNATGSFGHVNLDDVRIPITW